MVPPGRCIPKAFSTRGCLVLTEPLCKLELSVPGLGAEGVTGCRVLPLLGALAAEACLGLAWALQQTPPSPAPPPRSGPWLKGTRRKEPRGRRVSNGRGSEPRSSHSNPIKAHLFDHLVICCRRLMCQAALWRVERGRAFFLHTSPLLPIVIDPSLSQHPGNTATTSTKQQQHECAVVRPCASALFQLPGNTGFKPPQPPAGINPHLSTAERTLGRVGPLRDRCTA